jgi:lipopolysaccharide transport system permease protein
VAAHAETSRRFLPSFGWIRAYSELTTTLLRRELRVKYKGSSLGILWSYVYPLAMVAVYTLVFSVLWHAVKGIPHYPLFVLVGIAVWTFFQSAVQISAGSIVANAHLIRNVRFPREVIPAATVLSQAVASIVMFCVLVPVSLIVVPESAKTVILTVPIFIALVLLTLGIGWLAATATVFFRDVEHLLAVLFLPWFFLTPVLYSLDTLPRAANHPWVIHLLRYGNPVTPYIEAFRGALIQGHVAGASLLIYVFVVGPAFALVGLWCVQHYEDRFAVEV